MAVRTSSIVRPVYDQFRSTAATIRARLVEVIAQIDGAPLSTEILLTIYVKLAKARGMLEILLASPGLADYAKAIEGDPTYDVIAEGSAVISAITAVIAWVDTNYPRSGSYILAVAINDGEVTHRVLDAAVSSAFATQLASVVALIE